MPSEENMLDASVSATLKKRQLKTSPSFLSEAALKTEEDLTQLPAAATVT